MDWGNWLYGLLSGATTTTETTTKQEHPTATVVRTVEKVEHS